MKTVQKIKDVGKSGVCSEEDLFLFLPKYPVLSGSEFIFKISWANSKNYIDGEVEYFVKGLHLIEEKYKTKVNNNFGFGSPSPSFKVIQSYAKQNYDEALKLEKWIALNGGNYYVTKASNLEEFNSRISTK